MESLIQIKELRDMASEIPAAQISLKSYILSSEAVLGSYLHFQGKK
jgi:hypothetical protein